MASKLVLFNFQLRGRKGWGRSDFLPANRPEKERKRLGRRRGFGTFVTILERQQAQRKSDKWRLIGKISQWPTVLKINYRTLAIAS